MASAEEVVEQTPERRKRRGLLQMYYGSMDKKDEKPVNPLDIDGTWLVNCFETDAKKDLR